ncbi:hypothetical protein JNM87_02030 [Candidatus Saccharibacteria bacterium]|nr:hypothetical protein [Candidatus Saccharibacteria bacterium]
MVKSTTADTARGPNRDSNIAEIYSVLSALLVAGSIIDPPTDDSLDDSLRVNIPAAGTETPLVANTELTLLVNPSRGAGPVEKTIYDTRACRLGRAVLTVSLGETDLYLTPSSILNSSENTIPYIGLLIALGLYDKPNAQDAIADLPEDALILGGEGLHVVDLTQRSTETDTPLSGLVEMLQEIARRQSGLSAYGFFSNRLKNSTPEGEPLENQDALRGTIDLTPGSNRKAEFSTYFAGAQTKEN